MFVKTTLSLFVAVLFLCHLTATPAFGQSSWTYADTWMDDETGFDETGESSQAFIIGSGVAEIDTSSLAHSANMEVEIRSPQGRAEYGLGTWSQQSSGTSITVVVPINFMWEPADTGNYITNTRVQVTCPYEPGMSYASASFSIGLSFAAFFIEQNCNAAGCWYSRMQPCVIQCPGRPRLFVVSNRPGSAAVCVWAITPVGPFGCSRIFFLKKGVARCICSDIGWN